MLKNLSNLIITALMLSSNCIAQTNDNEAGPSIETERQSNIKKLNKKDVELTVNDNSESHANKNLNNQEIDFFQESMKNITRDQGSRQGENLQIKEGIKKSEESLEKNTNVNSNQLEEITDAITDAKTLKSDDQRSEKQDEDKNYRKDFSGQDFHLINPQQIFQSDKADNAHLKKPPSRDEYIKLLFLNVESENIAAINSLLNIFGTTEVQNKIGETPLIYAARLNKIKSVEFLIAKKANINAKNYYGKTAMDFAMTLDDKKVFNLLKQQTTH